MQGAFNWFAGMRIGLKTSDSVRHKEERGRGGFAEECEEGGEEEEERGEVCRM